MHINIITEAIKLPTDNGEVTSSIALRNGGYNGVIRLWGFRAGTL